MNKLIKYIFTRFIFFILIAFTAFGCNHMNTTPPNNIEMVNLLIKPDDMPSGWIVEFPAGPFHAAEYEEEAEKIVFVPERGIRRSTGQNIYRYEDAREARYYLRKLNPEVLGRGEFVPEGWIQPVLSADEEEFICYWKADNPAEKYLFCYWIARYGEYIVDFVTWVLPDLMSLEQIRTLIIKIDSKMVSALNN